MRPKGWSDLPPDLLREIAGHLHVAADFVSFHAVCRPWRSSGDLSSGKTTTRLLPWFLSRTEKHGRCSPLNLRCIFSKSSYRVLPPPYRRRRSLVYSAVGGTIQYLAFKQLRPTLHDPFTGAVTDLPRLPYYFDYPWEENPCGIVYGDGTTFLYGISSDGDDRKARFQMALLRPGDPEWRLVDVTFETNSRQAEFCAAYHSGRFLVSTESNLWRVVTPDDDDDVLVPRPCNAPDEPDSHREQSSYIMESHGELLWVSVYYSDDDKTFFVSVHVLEDATVPEKVRWVRKEGHSLADRVLFLGSPNSLAVDASLMGGQGGCAYFVYQHESNIGTQKDFGLFIYNFLDGKTDFIERLPKEWDGEECMWLVPQPRVAPIQEIIRRRLQAQKLKRQQKAAPSTGPSRIFHIERHYQHCFRVLIHGLPLNVKKCKLKLFFSKHGKVSSTEVIRHRNAKTKEGIVKMATMHAHEEDALAALRGLDFHGCRLEVILVTPRRA